MYKGKRILIINAHPDDYEFGMYGTYLKLKEDNEINIITLGKGRGHQDDNQFDKYTLLHWVKEIEAECIDFTPDVVFTHNKDDLNIDHQIVYNATITAFRPCNGVPDILSYEVLSSTEWNPTGEFKPDIFVNIINYITEKRSYLQKTYPQEMRPFPHPRSDWGIINLANYRGMQSGVEFAEAFQLVRSRR